MKTKKKPAATVDGFAGWPKSALQFLDGLHRDNSKAFFDAHRETYETAVRAPMAALLAELERDLGAGWDTKLFRVNRDLRFSRDKRPYNEHVAAVFMGSRHASGYYMQMSRDGLYVGAGSHQMASDQLNRYRDAVAGKDGEKLARIVSALIKDGYGVGDPGLKRVPAGYPPDHPRGELLRRTSVFVSRNWRPGPWLHTAEALDRVRGVLGDTRPLAAWLDDRVGPSTAPPRPGR
jgi:uncharacterized protein (TIGR02453 family)